MSAAFIKSLSKAHHTVNGDGHQVLARVMEVLSELVADRGCEEVEVSDDPLDCISKCVPVITTRDLDVLVHNEDRIGVKAVRSEIQRSTSKRILWVSVEGPTSVARKEAAPIDVQFMPLKSVCYNVSKHVLVPKHELISEVDIELEKLPKIFDTDVVVAYYGWKIGSVLKITRQWGGNEPVSYYRLVCAGDAV